MLSNPQCPACKSNRRVIASYKVTKEQAMQGMYTFNIPIPDQQYVYSCNSCRSQFKGSQK